MSKPRPFLYRDLYMALLVGGLVAVATWLSLRYHILSPFFIVILLTAFQPRSIWPTLLSISISTFAIAFFTDPIFSFAVHWQSLEGDRLIAFVVTAILSASYVRFRVRAQEKMQLDAMRLYDLYNLAPCGYHTVDVQGRITEINKMELLWLDYSHSEIVGMRTMFDLAASFEQARLHEVWQTFLTSGAIHDCETTFSRKDGTNIPVLLNGSALRDRSENITGARITVYNLSERITIEQERIKRQVAEEANKAKSQFFASMSHEIRTPLTAVMGFADFIADDGITSAERRRYAEVIRRNCWMLGAIIDDVLDLAKLEAGHFKVQLTEIDLGSFMEDTANILMQRAAAKEIRIEMQMAPHLRNRLTSDPLRLRQILLNLVDNAIKFSDQGSKVRVLVNKQEPSDGQPPMLSFTVEDTGMGIPFEEQTRLFQPFGQPYSPARHLHVGTGLGLYLSRHLARALGGELFLKSSVPQQGSEFTCLIPLEATEETESENKAAAPLKGRAFGDFPPRRFKPTKDDLAALRVLVVEDNPDHRIFISTSLSQSGCYVSMAGSGEEGLWQAQQEEFDLIIMDVNLPQANGWDIATTLRRHGYAKPILALTAKVFAEDRQRSLLAGCNDHLTKPITRERLLATVATLSKKSVATTK